jgi:hypothetical protein
MSSEHQMPEMNMDPAALYREEVFTDRKIGTIRRLVPVQRDGSTDESRDVRYMGQTQLMTPVGALPLSFEIEAGSLGEAAEKFGDGAQAAAEQAIEELQEMRREAASSIVTPGSGGFGGGGGLGGPGGGIQMP